MRNVAASAVEIAHRSLDQLGETPLWCDRERLIWWLDIERPTLHRLDPASGKHDARSFDATFLGSLALAGNGEKLIATDLTLNRLTGDGSLAEMVSVDAGLDNRLNDGRVDPNGRFWVGTMDNQLHRPNGSLYRIDADGTAHAMIDDVIVSNGIAFSPDGRTGYFTDTRRHLSWRLAIDPDDGAIIGREVFADYAQTGDRPDGATIDAEGCLWQAFFAGGRIVRYAPDGRIDTVVEMPVTNPTCVCFGGPDFRTLFVTTARKFLSDDQLAAEPLAGSLLVVEGIGQGGPEHRFVFS
ncbi:SMP-30/gluconolactonase/LRE family protein [Pelagibacterium sp.]|uniref:SMP-30/gluconolactonase/LRE family protein n=1 Tax=Pelagibacterium sp. TaxID=1967288 RepID=UPI003BAB43A2